MALTHTTRTVIIPAREEHAGYAARTVTLRWVCPVCGGPRGEPVPGISYDGSMRLSVHRWENPCGHVDFYPAVRAEADAGVSTRTGLDAPAPPLTTAERTVLEAARTLARAQSEVEAAMEAWMTAGEIGDGAEWDRLATARRARNDAADCLYDVASTGLAESRASDVPEFLRRRLPAAPVTNGVTP